MNQYPSHSQIPEFAKNESHTNPVLLQHPKPEEMRPSRRARFEANAKEFSIFVFLVAFPCWLVISLFMTFVFGG